MFNETTFKDEISALINRINVGRENEMCDRLSSVIDNLEDDNDFFQCLSILVRSSVKLSVHYHFIRYIYTYHDPLTKANKRPWGHDFQGYVSNIWKWCQSEPTLSEGANHFFKQLILRLYVDGQRNINALFDWLKLDCPKISSDMEVVGSGTHAEVHHSRNLNVAIKVFKSNIDVKGEIFLNPGAVRDRLNEVIIAYLLRNAPNIIQIHRAAVIDLPPRFTMRHATVGTLFDFINTYPVILENYHTNFMSQILSALIYMHGIDIVHRDIKPRNILLSKDENGCIQVQLADFGAAELITIFTKWPTENRTTPLFCAPEALMALPMTPDQRKKADVYSSALVWLVMFTKHGNPYFDLNINFIDLDSIKLNICTNEIRPTIDKFPEPYQALLVSMWDKTPDARPSASEAKRQIEALESRLAPMPS